MVLMTDKSCTCYDTRTLRYLRTQDAGVITENLISLNDVELFTAKAQRMLRLLFFSFAFLAFFAVQSPLSGCLL